MGTSERKQREREERETLFLDRAAELIENEGLVHLQMARLAEACDYSTGTLYQHFASKEDLLAALAHRHARTHLELFERVGRWQAPSRERIFALCVADQTFAQQHPAQFRLAQYVFTEAVWDNIPVPRREQILACSEPVSTIVGNIVTQARTDGDLPESDLNPLEVALGPWCLTQGMHTLAHTQGLLEAVQISNNQRLLYRHIQTLLNGMNWQPLMNPADDATVDALVARIQRDALLAPATDTR